MDTAFLNGTVGMVIRSSPTGQTWKLGGYKLNARFVEMPHGPDNTGDTYMQNTSTVGYFFFPSNLADPEPVVNAFAYWQLLWDESKSYYITTDDIVQSHAIGAMYNELDVDYYANMITGANYIKEEMAGYFPTALSKIQNSVLGPVASNKAASAYTAIDSIRGEVLSAIDEVMSR